MHCETAAKEWNYIPACPFWIKFWLCTQQSTWKITATAEETLSRSGSKQESLKTTDGISPGRSTVVPSQHRHFERELPPLCKIKYNHPHRNVEVVWLQWQGKSAEICTRFNCHHRAVKVYDCRAKLLFFFFLWENSLIGRHGASTTGG